jgi:hypothetical protein
MDCYTTRDLIRTVWYGQSMCRGLRERSKVELCGQLNLGRQSSPIAYLKQLWRIVVDRCRPRAIDNICYRGGAPRDVDTSAEPRSESTRQCYWNVVNICFLYCCFGSPRNTISILAKFSVVGFAYWMLLATNRHSVDSEKCNRDIVGLTTQRARCQSWALIYYRSSL